MTEQLRLMERVCDHMLEGKWSVPQVKPDALKSKKSVALFQKMMERTESKFQDAFPDSPDPAEGIESNYFETIQEVVKQTQSAAESLRYLKCVTEVVAFTGRYDEAINSYVIRDLLIRPCIWETGVVRQITDAAVRGLKQRQATTDSTKVDASPTDVQLQFQIVFGPSFLVSLTMDELPDLFTNDTPYIKKNVSGMNQTYTLPVSKFGPWSDSYNAVDIQFKQAWDTKLLQSEDNDVRFRKIRAKFSSYSETYQSLIISGLDAVDKVFGRRKLPAKKK
jgi:hypothetical protein